MKNLYTHGYCLALLLLVSAKGFSQLFVSPNSYVFVNDKMVFVNQDVNLQANGNIYLRNESQLLQGTAATSTNKGLGKLSVFQEGTVNNYAYNYWCSPIGNASAATGNENFGPIMLNRPTDVLNSTGATLLGTGVFDGIAAPLAIADRWIFTYLSNTTYAAWAPAGTATPNVPAGMGFTMKGSIGTDAAFSDHGQANNPGSAQRYDFRGKPNDGNITVTVGAGQRTLTGNPYPSAIDLKAYLLAATGTTKIAYFWEQDPTTNSHLIASYKGGYGTYSPIGGPTVVPYGNMGVYVPPTFYAYDGAGTQLAATGTGTAFERRFCPIGQGFMIEGSTGGTITMSNNFRVYIKEGTYSDFNRNVSNGNAVADTGFLPAIQSVSGSDYTTVSTAEIPQIRFNTLLNNQGVKQTALVFVPGASDGVELGMDAKSPEQSDIDMNFLLDNDAYVISVIDFDLHKKIPVGFKANIPATFKIAVADMINFSGAENVYLHDKQTDVYHSIKNDGYEFTLPAAGTVNDRYEITFLNETALSIPKLSADTFDVFQNNDKQVLTVSNPKLIDIASVSLYDLGGKQVFNKPQSGVKNSYEFSTSGIADAIYIVKILSTNGQQSSKKVTVYNGKN